jgi:hypothetical protein
MAVVRSSEMSVDLYQTTRNYFPEDCAVRSRGSEDLDFNKEA